MAKPKSAQTYERELRKLIEVRTGTECDPWLAPQIRATAINMVMLDRVFRELADEKTLVSMTPGSMAQLKSEVNPLLPYFDKMQRTLIQQYQALGLNYNTTPAKVTESTQKGVDEEDPMARYYKGQ